MAANGGPRVVREAAEPFERVNVRQYARLIGAATVWDYLKGNSAAQPCRMVFGTSLQVGVSRVFPSRDKSAFLSRLALARIVR